MTIDAAFSVNFSSVGKGPLIAGKAKNVPVAHFPGWEGGSARLCSNGARSPEATNI